MKNIFGYIGIVGTLLSISLSAQAQPKYSRPRPVPLDEQETPTETRAAAIIRAAPIMPYTATRSGFCCMLIDVNELGHPTKVDIEYCTATYFKKSSIKSVKKWRFNPANINGKPVKTSHQSVGITYLLA